jgi:hypothetical protein
LWTFWIRASTNILWKIKLETDGLRLPLSHINQATTSSTTTAFIIMDFVDEDHDDDEGEDDFFGSQNEGLDNKSRKLGGNYDDEDQETDILSSNNNYVNNDEFGSLMQNERAAKELELKTVAFLDAFDEYKDTKLQEGFEHGLLESLEVAIRIGKLLGKPTTVLSLKDVVGGEIDDKSDANDLNLVVRGGLKKNNDEKKTIDLAKDITREFFTNKFQKDDNNTCGNNNCQLDLQRLEDLLKETLLSEKVKPPCNDHSKSPGIKE